VIHSLCCIELCTFSRTAPVGLNSATFNFLMLLHSTTAITATSNDNNDNRSDCLRRALLNVCVAYTSRDEICSSMKDVAEGVSRQLIYPRYAYMHTAIRPFFTIL